MNLILFLTFAKNKVVYRIMEEAIKLIGERLKGLRESLDISVEEMAETCGVTDEKYLKWKQERATCRLVDYISCLKSMVLRWML